MSDTLSLLVASGILALGGLGLFMMKNNDDEDEKDTTASEERIGIRWFLPEEEKDERETDIENVPETMDDYVSYETTDVHKPRRRGKTHSNRRVSGSSRRRY
jgi:hypothetical protein